MISNSGYFTEKISCFLNNHLQPFSQAVKSCIEARYYTSLIDVAQNLTFFTSYYIYSELLMILFSN